jgi:hypothetical protein
MPHVYYSLRAGTNPHPDGLPLDDIKELFLGVYSSLHRESYFDEAFGFYCVDAGDIPGTVADVPREILLKLHKRNLWPIDGRISHYDEDDLFDIVEFLFRYVSKPMAGDPHNYGGCGMHWHTFSKALGQKHFREQINEMLGHYARRFELSRDGEILEKAAAGFEPIFDAAVPSTDGNVKTRIDEAVLLYRRRGSTVPDRRRAVRELADVLEYLRNKVSSVLTEKDEKDLFNIANNFGIRHHNDKQKTKYDAAIWLSWMFYFYLATIHALLRRMQKP